MTSIQNVTPLSQRISKIFVAAAALAVVASYAAAPAAAATRHPSSSPHHEPRQTAQPAAPPRHNVLPRHAAPPAADRSAKPTGRFAVLRPPSPVRPVIARPARAPKVPAIVRPVVKLWRGTPSYRLRPNIRLRPASLPGITGHCQVTAGNHSGTWSPASCPDGYEVQGDVTVPLGKTLTVKANTVVYFDTTPEGSLTPLDPSELTDLIVDGTLTIAGTAAAPVLFTSANAAPHSVVDPQAGDWGYVFFNHTGSNKGTGSMTDLRLRYGEGIAADRVAPPITSSTISNVAGGLTAPLIATSIQSGAGIDYEDIPGGTVTLEHDVFDGAALAGIDLSSSYGHPDFSGADAAGHPFTLHLTDSKITGGGFSGLEDTVQAESFTDGASASTNHSGVTLDMHGNHLTETGDGNALEADAESEPTAVVGTAAVSGVFNHNVVTGGDDSSGIYLYAYTGDSSSTGTKACDGASACVDVPFMSDRISSEDEAVDVEAFVDHGTGRSLVDTPIGKVEKKKVHKKHHKTVTKLVDVGGGTFVSNGDETWGSEADNDGTGAAKDSTPVVASTFNAYDECMDIEAEADFGSAATSIPVRHSTMTSSDDENIEVDTEGSEDGLPPSGSSGSAHTTVSLTGGHYVADDENIEIDDTSADYGAATGNITVKGATLTADDSNIENFTYASEHGGSGGGTGNVVISKSKLSANDGSVENEAYAYQGAAPASAKVTATGSKLEAYDDSAVENNAYSAQDSPSHGAATVTTTFDADKVQAYDEGMDLDASSNYGGSATSNPKIVNSTVLAGDDDAIDNEVRSAEDGGSGAATGSPLISGSTVDAEDYVVDNDVEADRGSGLASGSPTITKSTVSSRDDYIIDNTVQGTDNAGSSGAAVGKPVISGGSAVAGDYLIYNYVQASYGGANGSPVLKNTTAVAGDDYGIYNEVYASTSVGHGSATADPVISGSTIHAYEYGIYNEAYSYGGKSTGNPEISHSTVVASSDDAIYNLSDSNELRGIGATATADPRIIDSTTTSYDEAIYSEAYSYQGPAVANPVVKNSTATVTDNDAIDNYAYSSESGNTGSATLDPVISGSTITAYDYGLYNDGYGDRGSASAKPAISHTHISSLFESAFYNEAYGGQSGVAGSATASPTVSSSPLYCGECSGGYGLYNYASSYSGTATASPVITSSPIRNADGYGVYNQAYAAQSAGHGIATAHPSLTSSPITSYDYGFNNEAAANDGNSPADASFSIKGSRIHTIDDSVANVVAQSQGTGASTVKPAVTGLDARAADDDIFNLNAEPKGSGPAVVGGHISDSTLVGEGDILRVDAAPSGTGGASTFDTTLAKDEITSLDDDGIDADYSSSAASLTMAPTLTDDSITAPDDYAVDLQATGYGGTTSDEVRVAPVISGTPTVSEDGIYLTAYDNSGSTEPGRVEVEGSIKGSSVVSTDYYGVYATSACGYCTGGARTAVTVSNTPLNSEDGAGYFAATTAATTTASSSVGGSATSTHHGTWTARDGDAVYANSASAAGHATDSLKVTGLHLSGSDGAIYNSASAVDGNASNTASFKGNTIDNSDSSSGEDGVYDSTSAGGAGHDATRTGSISDNDISDLPGDGEGIYEYMEGSNTSLPNLTIAHNTITNVGSAGIDVEAYWAVDSPSSDSVTVSHNTISRTGDMGIYLYGAKPEITSNLVTAAGLAGDPSDDNDGIYEDLAPVQGSVTCNDIWANNLGVEYGPDNPVTGSGGYNGDPKTNDNSFRAPSSSVRNSTDLKTANPGTGRTNAQNNYWGGSPRLGTPASRYDTTPRLSSAPKCVKTAGA